MIEAKETAAAISDWLKKGTGSPMPYMALNDAVYLLEDQESKLKTEHQIGYLEGRLEGYIDAMKVFVPHETVELLDDREKNTEPPE